MVDRINETQSDDEISNEDPTDSRGFGSSRKIFAILASATVILALMILLGIGLANRSPVTARSGVTRIGKPAPARAFTTFSGQQIDLSDQIGKPVVINFWASWCGPCRREAIVLENLWQAYGDREVVFIGVDIQDSEADARASISEYGVTYPNGMDQGGRISIDYGVIGIPVTFLVDKEGVVARRWVGSVRQSQITPWLEELVAGVDPSGPLEGENLEDFRSLNQLP